MCACVAYGRRFLFCSTHGKCYKWSKAWYQKCGLISWDFESVWYNRQRKCIKIKLHIFPICNDDMSLLKQIWKLWKTTWYFSKCHYLKIYVSYWIKIDYINGIEHYFRNNLSTSSVEHMYLHWWFSIPYLVISMKAFGHH